MYFSEWNIFLEANLLLIIVLVFVYLVGYSFNFLCHRLFNIKSEYSLFKKLFYGVLLIIYFFVLFKSKSILNSVFLSGIPFCLFIYEYYLHKNFCDFKKNQAFNSKTIVISLITIAIILIAKFKFHFSDQINLGYGDYSFYHSVAKHLLDTGIETINIQKGLSELSPGFIYHYWDLWFFAFVYWVHDCFNYFDVFNGLNYFEIYTLVAQPLLYVIIYFGLFELANLLFRNLGVNNKFEYTIPLIVSIAMLIRIVNFSVLVHSKQFILGVFIIYFLLELKIFQNKFPFIYIIFAPAILFAYPIPGSVLIITFFVLITVCYGFFKSLKSFPFYGVLVFALFTLVIYYLYYFHYAITCLPNSTGEIISINDLIYSVFIYNGYHTVISINGILIIFNILLVVYLIKSKVEIIGNAIKKNLIVIITFCIVNCITGHLIAALLYMVPEQFQFYNNDYYSVAILLIIDTLIFCKLFKKKLNEIVIYLFMILCFLICSYFYFNSRPIFDSALKLRYKDYFKLKGLIKEKELYTSIELPVLYQIPDILYSIFNRRVQYSFDLCNKEKKVLIHSNNKNQSKSIIHKREGLNKSMKIIDVIPYQHFSNMDSIYIVVN
jgi:hypothetical protein